MTINIRNKSKCKRGKKGLVNLHKRRSKTKRKAKEQKEMVSMQPGQPSLSNGKF